MRKQTKRFPLRTGVFAVMTWCALNGMAAPLFAQNQKPPIGQSVAAPSLPPLLINDWRPVGIDPAELAKARTTLNIARDSLIKAVGSNPQSLTKVAVDAGKTMTLNMKRISDRISAVVPTSTFPVPIVIEPVWCSVADRHAIFVTVARSDNNELLASAHTTVARADLTKSLKNNGDIFSPALVPLAAKALEDARTKAAAQKNDALHVGLSPAIPESRNDTGSGQCLNFLSEEILAKNYTVARSVGADRVASLHAIYQVFAKMRRPTRLFVMQWQQQDAKKPSNKLPTTLVLKSQIAESVFGHSTPRTYNGTVGVTLGIDRRVQVDLPPEFLQLFAAEKNSLLLSDWPQVAKIYGAWVYLDRGRAWGLKMNDRMIAMIDGQPVKGHVVRFYGPEQKLSSPRGFPIEEGAILYIRKGQKLPKTGLEFRFDPRQFPTAYPIPPGN